MDRNDGVEWTSPLRVEHEAAGAVFGTVDGASLPRRFADPGDEYRSAVEGVAVADPGPSLLLQVTGRSPAEMVQGIMTNSVPEPLDLRSGEVLAGRAAYGAVLTPKGKMVTDLRVGWRGASTDPGLLIQVPRAGAHGALDHFRRFIPPRLARIEDRSSELYSILVLGLEAPSVLSRVGLGLRVEAGELEELLPDGVLAVGEHPAQGIRVRRSDDYAAPVWELTADRPTILGLWRALRGAGAHPAGWSVLETLRVEAGRPAFGRDMDESTIPVEAGIQARAVDDQKGCYTGQEVIVRIRDRGRVNRHLRGLRFGEGPAVPAGATLHREGEEKALGEVTSEALSPRAGQTVGLGYVRREVEPPATLRLGGPQGPPVEVLEITGPNWAFR